MNKNLLKLICVFTLALGLNTTTKAQLVYIPDSAFRVYLNQNFGVCMVGDSINPSCTNLNFQSFIDVSNKGITDLTGIEYFLNLRYLNCNNNLLTGLPPLPSGLLDLYCQENQLLKLPTLPSTLKYLSCYINMIDTLPALPNALKTLICSDNQITFIPPFGNLLEVLNCQNNPITCLPNLKNLKQLVFTNTLINCLPNHGQVTASSPNVTTLPLCGIYNSNHCELFWNIEGKVYLDKDSSCTLGINESGRANHKLKLSSNGILLQQTYSNINGDFDFDTQSFGFYKTVYDTTNSPFKVKCPSPNYYNDYINATSPLKYNRNFSLICKGIDLAVKDVFIGILRPARPQEVKIQAGDLANYFGERCAIGTEGIVTIKIIGPANYYYSSGGALLPDSINGKTLTYIVNDFGTIDFNNSFNFHLLVDTTVVLGSPICIQVTIGTNLTESNYNNNFISECFPVVGSFDPNDKSVYPNSYLDISGDRWLTYTIRFQNTGTASAEHILITDTLNSAFDFSTFTLLSFSHQPITQIYNDGLLKFNYPYINLPDSNTNEPESHGFIKYKIRATDTLLVGTNIQNTANIFFDFNAPVITNTTSNIAINCSIPPTIITAYICEGDIYYLNDAIYYKDGIHRQKLITQVGCDSIIELNLNYVQQSHSLTQMNGILMTPAAAVSYQWLNCTNDSIIFDATTQSYAPTQSGSYAVIVTFNNCIDTSNCFNITNVGLPSSIGADVIFQTRYNSNADQIQLHAEKLKGNKGVLRLMDISGRIIFQKQIENIAAGNLDLEIPAKGMNAGIYLVNLITERDNISGKVVKY
ncbi:MAG: T9SS type A sorting domain-containing protein [Bacteroidia bacterium]